NEADPITGVLSFRYYTDRGEFIVGAIKQHPSLTILHSTTRESRLLPHNTWYTIKLYVDFNAKKAYYVLPYATVVADILMMETGTDLIEKYKPTGLGCFFSSTFQRQSYDSPLPPIEEAYVKIDNIKISALQSVPP